MNGNFPKYFWCFYFEKESVSCDSHLDLAVKKKKLLNLLPVSTENLISFLCITTLSCPGQNLFINVDLHTISERWWEKELESSCCILDTDFYLSGGGWNQIWNQSWNRGTWNFHGGKICVVAYCIIRAGMAITELMLFLSYEMSKVKEQEEIDPIFCSKCFFCQLIAGYLVHTHMQPFLYFFKQNNKPYNRASSVTIRT